MANHKGSLWILAYAIGDKKYACSLCFGSQAQAEARVNHILSYAKHIKKIGLYEDEESRTKATTETSAQFLKGDNKRGGVGGGWSWEAVPTSRASRGG